MPAERYRLHAQAILQAHFGQLVFQQTRGEGRRIDRALQLRPQMADRADVIFMSVGEHDGQNILALLGEIADIGHDEVDARRRALAAEQHAAIDHDPLAVVRRAETIGVEIHADLTRATKREQYEFVVAGTRH